MQIPILPSYRNILPLTFDDSLTYYEQMLQLYNVVNECYKQVSEIYNSLDGIVDAKLKGKLQAVIDECNSYTNAQIKGVNSELILINVKLTSMANEINTQYTTITDETDAKLDIIKHTMVTMSVAISKLTEILDQHMKDNNEQFKELYNNIEDIISKYMQKLSLNVYVWNPTNLMYEDVQKGINDVYRYSRYGQFTAGEYHELGLNAEQYDKQFFTAKKYETNVKHKWLHKIFHMLYSMFDGKRKDVREVVTNLGDWMKPYPLTASEYDNKNLSAKEYDNYNISGYDYDFNAKYETEGLKNYKRIESVRDLTQVKYVDQTARIDLLETDVAEIENDLETLNEGLQTTNNGLTEVKENVTLLTKSVDNLTLATETNAISITSLTDKYDSLERKTNANTTKITEIETTTNNTNKDLESLKEVVKKDTETLQGLVTKQETTDVDISTLKTDVTNLKTGVHDLDTIVENHDTLITNNTESINGLEGDVGDVNELNTEEKVVVKAINWLKAQLELIKGALTSITNWKQPFEDYFTYNTNNKCWEDKSEEGIKNVKGNGYVTNDVTGAIKDLTTRDTTNIVNAVNSLVADRGIMTILDTENKASLVMAINEVNKCIRTKAIVNSDPFLLSFGNVEVESSVKTVTINKRYTEPILTFFNAYIVEPTLAEINSVDIIEVRRDYEWITDFSEMGYKYSVTVRLAVNEGDLGKNFDAKLICM